MTNPDVDPPPTSMGTFRTTPSHDRGAVVARNVGFNVINQFWFAALAIVTTPYIVRNLGVDSYGLWVIVSAVLGYFSFLDLGLGAALVKYISEYDAAGDDEAVERVLRTGSGAYLVLGAAGAGVIALLAPFFADHVLTLNTSDQDIAQVAFYLAALGFLVNLPAQTFAVIPAALQRFDVVVIRTIVFGSLSISGTVAVLALGYGLLAVLLVSLVITVVTAASFFLKARRLLPDVSFVPWIYGSEIRLLMRFGLLKATQRASTLIVFHLDRLVVSAFAPIAAVAYYAVPLSLSQHVLRLVGNVGTAVFPAASALAGQRDERRVEDLYLRATKLTALIALPIASMMFIYAHQIMRYWLSDEFEVSSSGVLMILAAANVLYAATTVPAVTLDATGRVHIATVFGLAAAATNLVLVFALVPTIGYQGAAWAVFANAAIQVPMLLYYVHTRVLRVSLRDLFMRSLARPLFASAVLWPAMIWARQYATSLALVTVLCLLTLVFYVGLTLVIGAYDARDRSLVRSFVRR